MSATASPASQAVTVKSHYAKITATIMENALMENVYVISVTREKLARTSTATTAVLAMGIVSKISVTATNHGLVPPARKLLAPMIALITEFA